MIFPTVDPADRTGFASTHHVAESSLEHALHRSESGYPDFLLLLGETLEPKEREQTMEAQALASFLPQYSLQLGWDSVVNRWPLDQGRR